MKSDNLHEIIKEAKDSIHNIYIPEILESNIKFIILTSTDIIAPPNPYKYALPVFNNKKYDSFEDCYLDLYSEISFNNLFLNKKLADSLIESIDPNIDFVAETYNVYYWEGPMCFKELDKSLDFFEDSNFKSKHIQTIEVNDEFLHSKKRDFSYKEDLLYYNKKLFTGFLQGHPDIMFKDGLPILIRWRENLLDISLKLSYGDLYHKGFLFAKENKHNIKSISVEIHHSPNVWNKNCLYKSKYRWGYCQDDQFVDFVFDKYELSGKVDLIMFLKEEKYFYNRNYYLPIEKYKDNVSVELTEGGKEMRDEHASNERAIDEEIKYNKSLQRPYNDDLDMDQQSWLGDI